MKQVLVIEDNMDNLGLIRLALQRVGYRVISAATGTDGIRLASQLSLAFIIVDINLPDTNGYEVTKCIKRCGPNSTVPIVAITSSAMRGDRDKCLEAGCDAYFEKPIDPITIVDQIHAAIGLT